MRAAARHQRGQTIVIALLVLLLLAFVGGLFATIVTRNLANAARSNRVQSADYYAEAGIRFANDQLTTSLDGADWRPPLQYQLVSASQPKDRYGSTRYATVNSSLQAVPANDPDAAYLGQGFTRYNIGGGRYLLRVTYDPVGLNNPDTAGAADPRARYIKIESVGREGSVDSSDPTTYRSSPRTQLNATLIQYKAIGITDYARFETNPENRSDVMPLGVASQYDATANGIVTPGVSDFNGGAKSLAQYPVVTTYGAADAYLTSGSGLIPNPAAGSNPPTSGALSGGGSIHANGSVRFYGQNNIFLDNSSTADVGYFGDTVEIAGNILLDNYNPANALTTQDAAVQAFINQTASATPTGTPVYPSADPKFDTDGGAIRDSGTGNDANGQPRSVNRLEPPTLDTVNPVTNLPRYADITKNSTLRPGVPVADTTAAAYGYGQSIYVDNTTDVQRESSSLVGGYTLIDEWLHRRGANDTGSKSGWVASFYRPPGVDIMLGRQIDSGGKTFYGVRLTRSDVDGAGSPIGWKNPDGSAISGVSTDGSATQSTMTVSYTAMNASNDLTLSTVNTANPDNDVIIYAAGNVRVHGSVSADMKDSSAATADTAAKDLLPRHVTIVTGGTAYIDGSLMRGNPESSITILAHDYVCVNTTQLLAGTIADQNPGGTSPPSAYAGDPSLRALDFSASDEVLLQEFTLPDATADANPRLYVSGGPLGTGATAADFDLIDISTGLSVSGKQPFLNPTPATATPPVAFSYAFDTSGAGSSAIQRTSFALPTGANGLIVGASSQAYQLGVRRDQGADASLYTQDFLLERAAILPMDIKIEAVLFAQTRSFFVIPGDWFNSSSDDNLTNFSQSNGASRPGIDVNNSDQNRFPFFGQPIDMKITVSGAISEARPADVTAQSAWMAKWGWIPQYHGGYFSESAGHTGATANTPGIGLQVIYNPLAGFPYYTDHYLRTDSFGRPLPYAPKLPVCTGLLYAGQNSGASVLQ